VLIDKSVILDQLIDLVGQSRSKLTPIVLAKTAARRFALPVKSIKELIQELVTAGHLTYTNQYGITFLEISFNQPVRVSKHLVLTPPQFRYEQKAGDIIIKIAWGASFGSGQHPTTRLSLQALDFMLADNDHINDDHSFLDMGTGSGVLAIAAAGLGMTKGIAVDIDPCARAEAKANIALNGFADRILVCRHLADTTHLIFSLITANLRYPSLQKMAARFSLWLADEGVLVLSGFKKEEMDMLLAVYENNKFVCVWQKTEQGWASVVLRRKTWRSDKPH
jgi:ribosomal protein L11 methyltransferase